MNIDVNAIIAKAKKLNTLGKIVFGSFFILFLLIVISIARCTSEHNTKPAVTTYKPAHFRINNDSYALHVKAAKKHLKGKIFTSNDEIQIFADKNLLKKVKDEKGYKLDNLTHSLPYLSNESLTILENIGEQFENNAGKGNYFIVTSLTRSVQSQTNLTKVNINASKNVSTHSYGASFDISYVRFNGVKEYNSRFDAILGEILYKLQKEKKIFVLKEKKVGCYHVTAIIP